ncbi:hypothetical protein [Mycoplasma sp. P36-A1]|uniref:hypothetical protein n=1 Tax=Mycoplasma sp. P36-A1 TaxID=3252900 RepID=UPI003C2F2CE3
MNSATRIHFLRSFLISIATLIIAFYLNSVYELTYNFVSFLMALSNGLLVLYFYNYLYNNKKSIMEMQKPISIINIFYIPIIMLLVQSLIFDMFYSQQYSESTMFVSYIKYLAPCIGLMWMSSSRSIIKIIISYLVGSLFVFTILLGFDGVMNNLNIVYLKSTHPFSILITLLLIFITLILSYKTFMIHRKEHNHNKLATYYYLEMLVFIIICFQKLFIVKLPYSTFFSTIRISNYQIIWGNYFIAIVSLIAFVYVFYKTLNKKILALYLLPVFLVSTIYMVGDRLLDKSKVNCEIIAQLNSSVVSDQVKQTIHYNNVPLIGFNSTEYETFTAKYDKNIKRCMSAPVGQYDSQINEGYIKDNNYQTVIMNGIMYLVDSNIKLQDLYSLSTDVNQIVIYNAITADRSESFTYIPENIDEEKYSKIITEINKISTKENIKIYIIRNEKFVNLLEDNINTKKIVADDEYSSDIDYDKNLIVYNYIVDVNDPKFNDKTLDYQVGTVFNLPSDVYNQMKKMMK